MARIGRLPADKVVEGRVGDTLGRSAFALEEGAHGPIAGRLVDEAVFALDIQEDDRQSGGLGLGDEAGDGRRFAAAGGADDAGVPREDTFLGGGRADRDVVVAHGQPQPDVAADAEDGAGLGFGEGEDGAVGQRAKPGRLQDAVDAFAHELDLDAAVVTGHEDAAVDRSRHNQRGVGAQSVRLGERALDHNAQVLAAVRLAVDPDQGLRWQGMQTVLREEHRN